MMTEAELYKYDVDGFLLLEDVLTPEGSWQKYLLRRPNGYMEMHPRPGGRAYEEG